MDEPEIGQVQWQIKIWGLSGNLNYGFGSTVDILKAH